MQRQAPLVNLLVRSHSRQSASLPDSNSALRLRQFRAMRPDLFKGVAILADQLRHVPVEEGHEDVIGIDGGVARH